MLSHRPYERCNSNLFCKSTSPSARYTIGFAWITAQLHVKHDAVCGQVVQVVPLPFQHLAIGNAHCCPSIVAVVYGFHVLASKSARAIIYGRNKQ